MIVRAQVDLVKQGSGFNRPFAHLLPLNYPELRLLRSATPLRRLAATHCSPRLRILNATFRNPHFFLVSGLMFQKDLGIIRAEISRMVFASIFSPRKIVAARRLLLGNSSLASGPIKSLHRHANICSQRS
jgi:hypothetical protein